MAANTSINLVDLDPDTIRENLKTYLSSQSQFKDYDFEGSNLGVLLNVLAYNTFNNAFYLNMVAAESYLDSAQMRNSVVSHAKELNYVPRSARSAKATVSLSFTSDESIVTIPKGTSFTSLVGFGLYTFITDREAVYFSSNGTFLIEDVEIYEGHETSDTFVMDYNNTTQRFLIADPAIDTRSIEIEVIEDNDGSTFPYTQASTTLDLDDDSLVFFLQGAEDGKYEIVFGDDIIGRRPKNGAIIRVSYRVCNGTSGNGAARFQLDDEFTAFTSTPSVNTVDIGRGGAEEESVESIKFYAPRYFQTQERAVNVTDYEIILRQRFPEINAISAYGGEDVEPPQYGRVFIAVDISDVDGLPSTKIDEYLAFLKPRSPLSIDPSFVEPEYTYYRVESTVSYNINETNYNSEQIKSAIVNEIVTFDETYLNDFKSSFRYSKFVAALDSIEDAGIESNDTKITVYKKIAPSYGEVESHTLAFDIVLTREGAKLGSTYDDGDLVAVRSSEFIFSSERVYIADDGDGILRLVKTVGDTVTIIRPNIGTVDYDSGLVQIIDLQVDAIPDSSSEIRIYVETASNDFSTSKNVILALEGDQISIEAVPIRGTSTQSRQRA